MITGLTVGLHRYDVSVTARIACECVALVSGSKPLTAQAVERLMASSMDGCSVKRKMIKAASIEAVAYASTGRAVDFDSLSAGNKLFIRRSILPQIDGRLTICKSMQVEPGTVEVTDALLVSSKALNELGQIENFHRTAGGAISTHAGDDGKAYYAFLPQNPGGAHSGLYRHIEQAMAYAATFAAMPQASRNLIEIHTQTFLRMVDFDEDKMHPSENEEPDLAGFPWGRIDQVHSFGPYRLVEYNATDFGFGTEFALFHGAKSLGISTRSMSEGLLTAIDGAFEGNMGTAAGYYAKGIGLDAQNEPAFEEQPVEVKSRSNVGQEDTTGLGR